MPWRLFRKRRDPAPRPLPIDVSSAWVIVLEPPGSPATFVRALPRLLPPEAMLVLENAGRPEVLGALAAHASNERPPIRKGTIFPPDRQTFVPISASAVVADLLERHPPHHVCWHLHATTKERVLLQWHDAFSDPCLLSERFSREDVESFCREAGCEMAMST